MVSCIAVTGALFALVYAVAPNIYMLQANAGLVDLSRTIRVDLLPEHQETEPILRTEPELDTLASRPGSVRDLLKREDVTPAPEDTLPEVPVQDSDPAERLAQETVAREHDLRPDPALADSLDAKILEISREAARRDIEVARRLVRPSSRRVVQEDEFPTFRSASAGAGDLLHFAALAADTGGGPGSGFGGPGGLPRFEGGVLSPEPDEGGLPALPIEELLARAPVEAAIRDTSTHQPIDDLVTFALNTYVDPRSGEGFFRLEIAPRSERTIDVLPKEVTFVIDASRSIIQRKLDESAQGIMRCVDLLRPDDKFNVVIFRDTPSFFRETTVNATPANKAEAKEFLTNLESRGATDVYAAVREVVLDAPLRGVSGTVIVVSDGRPTSGALAGRDLINALTAENVHRTTIYTIGAGRTVNQYLLDLLAYRNKGVSFIVPRIEDMDDELPRFFDRINDPILTALDADYGQIDEADVFPREIPDFYRGRAVTVYGKFDPLSDREVVMRLEGSASGQDRDVVFKADLTKQSGGDVSIARNWAFQKSYYLIGQICEQGERPEYVQELNRLSRTYGVRTSYTP